jgi:hypothetical protein
MLLILGTLIGIHEITHEKGMIENIWQKWVIQIPFSVYLGWITVATVANVTALLVVSDWGRFDLSEQFWTIFMIIIASLITFTMQWFRKNNSFSLVILWAFLGIIIKRTNQTPKYPGIVITAIIFMSFIALFGIFIEYQKYKKKGTFSE